MHNIFEHRYQKYRISDVEKDKIISFWQAQAFFNIDTNHFKNNLSLLLDNVSAEFILLTINHGATQPLHQLVYGGEYEGLHFDNAKNSAKNNYADQVYNNLFMMGWTDKHIEMRISANGKITYSIGYQATHKDLSEWHSQHDNNYEYIPIQPAPILNFSDPITLRRIKLERINESIKLHPFNRYSNLHGGRSESAEKILEILENAFEQNSYHTKEGYLAIVDSIAKTLEGKTKTTKGTYFFGLGARTDTTVQLYKNILKEIEDDICELKQAGGFLPT